MKKDWSNTGCDMNKDTTLYIIGNIVIVIAALALCFYLGIEPNWSFE
jgi:hypothetical protein